MSTHEFFLKVTAQNITLKKLCIGSLFGNKYVVNEYNMHSLPVAEGVLRERGISSSRGEKKNYILLACMKSFE